MNSFWLLLLTIITVSGISDEPILIVVSYDAFRYNYLDRGITEYISFLRKQGTHARFIKSIFPTKTFANLHTIATGVYPAVHGVVGNKFYDPEAKKVVDIQDSYNMYRYNQDALPIWILNELAGKNRISGSMMWPGADQTYKGKKAFYIRQWNQSVPYIERVDQVISWLTDYENPANLVMFYIEQPGTIGHFCGPNHPLINMKIKELDGVTKYLHQNLKKQGLDSRVNVVHIADHGMVPVTLDRVINVSDIIGPNSYWPGDTSPFFHITPKKKRNEAEMYKKLKEASESNHFTVYRRRDVPEQWHHKDNPRIPPIFLLADPNYGFEDLLPYFDGTTAAKYNMTLGRDWEVGVHGYDSLVRDMNPYFLAYGPDIRESYEVSAFSTIDLYSLFCDVLDIKPLPNNGSYDNIVNILKHPNNLANGIQINYLILFKLIVSLISI